MQPDSAPAFHWRSLLSPPLLVAIGVWLVIFVLFLIALRGTTVDDMYVTYRYARNLAAGDGFVFNPGERVFGLTNPGVGLILGVTHWVTGLSIPGLGTGLFGLGLLGLAILLAVEARERGRLPEALAGGTMVMGCAFIWVSRGSAQPWVLLLLAAAALTADRRPWLAGVLAGFAVWMRPEAGLGVGVLGVMLWIEHRRLPWRYGVAAAGVILSGLALALLYYGTPFPNTLAAKQAAKVFTGRHEPGSTFWPKAVQAARLYLGQAIQPLIVLGLTGLGAAFLRGGRALRIVVLYAVTLLVAFPAFSVGFFIWYALPTVAGLLYGAAYGAGEIARRLAAAVMGTGGLEGAGETGEPGRRRLATAALALVLGLAVLWPVARPVLTRSWDVYSKPYRPPPRLAVYHELGTWLRENTPEGTRVAHTEIGVLGWESERPLQDLIGLVTPASIPYLEERAIAGALLDDPAEYVVVPSRGWLHPISQTPWFQRAYEPAGEFSDDRVEEVIRLYRKRPGARLPPPPRSAPRPARPRGPRPTSG